MALCGRISLVQSKWRVLNIPPILEIVVAFSPSVRQCSCAAMAESVVAFGRLFAGFGVALIVVEDEKRFEYPTAGSSRGIEGYIPSDDQFPIDFPPAPTRCVPSAFVRRALFCRDCRLDAAQEGACF